MDATLGAAIVAGSVATATLIWTVIAFAITQKRLTRFQSASIDAQNAAIAATDRATVSQERSASRDQWRMQFEMALRLALSNKKNEQAEGISQIEGLKSAPWIDDYDRLRAIEALQRLTGGSVV